jgi:hypothetical protein
LSATISNRTKGTVTAKRLSDPDGKLFKVSKEEFYSDDDLVGASYGEKHGSFPERNHKIGNALRGMTRTPEQKLASSERSRNIVTATNLVTGEVVRISKSEFDSRRDLYAGHTTGWGNYRNSVGEIIHCSTEDPRVLSGELVHMSKDMIYGVDYDGTSHYVHISDPRFANGEFRIAKRVYITNDTEELYVFDFQVNEYPDYRIGSLMVACPLCGEMKTKRGMKNHKCKVKPAAQEMVTCPVCGRSNMNNPSFMRSHFGNCKGPKPPKVYIQYIQKTCPHCGFVGNGGNMLRYHFDNCKHNPEK